MFRILMLLFENFGCLYLRSLTYYLSTEQKFRTGVEFDNISAIKTLPSLIVYF